MLLPRMPSARRGGRLLLLLVVNLRDQGTKTTRGGDRDAKNRFTHWLQVHSMKETQEAQAEAEGHGEE